MKLYLSPEFSIPADAVSQTFGILAVRGAGKTNTAVVLAEEMYKANLPFVAIDPVGSWWGIRASVDGKAPGLPIVLFGGRHGDVPLERGAGQMIADLVVDQRLTCVLDVSDFSETDKVYFLRTFAERLYRRNEAPLHLFLEEADDYIPQRPFREQAHLLRAFENIVRRGRARGLGITMITQRSAALNKNVLTQIETLIVLRTTSPNDRKAIAAWVEYHGQGEELLESLQSLPNGEAWIWSPSWLKVMERVQIRRRATFDSGATPKDVKSKRTPATVADIDLGAIREQMAATIERAKTEDPKELRKRIAELEKQLKDRAAGERIVEKEKIVEVPVLKDGQLDKAQKLVDTLEGVSQLLANAFGKIKAPSAKSPVPSWVPRANPKPIERKTQPAPIQTTTNGDAGLSGPEQRILDAIGWFEKLGIRDPQQTAVAFLAGYTYGGGAFNNPRGSLNTKGLVEYKGDRIGLTDAGRHFARAPGVPLTTEELQQHVMERLPGPESRILQVLISSYPQDLAKEELAQAAGYAQGGAFNNPLGRLRSLGLIDYPTKGRARARDLLFVS